MLKREFLLKSAASVGVAALLLAGCTTTPMSRTGDGAANKSIASDATKKEKIDAGVTSTLERLYTTVPGSRDLVNKANGVLVFPSVLAAGFVVGGEYGEGALRVRGKTVDYYSTVTGSFGLQIGAQSKAIIFLFMTQDALDKFRNSKGWTAGVDASVAVVRAGVNGAVTTAAQPVNVIVMTNAGLMANLNVEGSKITKLN